MSMLEPLDSEIAALFGRERSEHRQEPMAREEVLHRAERAIRLAALAPPPGDLALPPSLPAPPRGLLGGASAKVLLGVALAAAFGGGVVVGRASAPTPTPTSPSPSFVVTASRSESPSPSPSEGGPLSIEASALPPAPPAPSAPSASSAGPRARPDDTVSDLAREQELVDTARGALARGRAAEALAATERHSARFPNGALAEERDALAVQALALDGRIDEARLRASRFTARYPRSIFRPAVERAATPQKQIP